MNFLKEESDKKKLNLSSFPNRADEVKVHDDRSSPEGGVVLPGGAGNCLGLGEMKCEQQEYLSSVSGVLRLVNIVIVQVKDVAGGFCPDHQKLKNLLDEVSIGHCTNSL